MDPDKLPCPARLLARCAAAYAAGRSRLRAEAGSVLVEVMVGAVVLAIASVAILNGIDGAQGAGAQNKAHSVQSALAQQDIERMRAIPITALSNYRETRTVAVAGVNYTVVSRTDWVRDATGVVGCTANTAQAQYLKLSSTVTSPSTTDRPVKETGLLTPGPGQLSTTAGTAMVKLTDPAGQPMPGVPVSLTGPSSLSDRTDDQGCAVFGYVATGTYTAQVTNYVTPASTVPAQATLVVSAGLASLVQMQIALPAALRANFVPPSGNTFFPGSPTDDAITVVNSGLPSGSKLFTSSGAGTSVDATNLFPFTNAYGVFAGNCSANNPATYLANYYQPGGRGYAALNPGDALVPVNVEMPTIRIRVTRQPVSSVVPTWVFTQLKVTPLDSGCTYSFQVQTPNRVPPTNATEEFNLALPFGRYRVCAATRGRTSSTNSNLVNRRYTTTTTAGTNPVNPADLNLTTVPPQANRQMNPPDISTVTLSTQLCF